MNSLNRLNAQCAAVLLLVSVAGCGGVPEPRPAVDLGAELTPTEVILDVANDTGTARGFMVTFSAYASDVPPDDVAHPYADNGEVAGILQRGDVLPGHDHRELDHVPVYAYRLVTFTVESWDAGTGENRAIDEISIPGRVPAMSCRVAYRADGTYGHSCQ